MKQKLALLATLPALYMGQAQAAIPAGVEDAIETAGTDGATVAGVVLVAVIAMFAVKLLRKAL